MAISFTVKLPQIAKRSYVENLFVAALRINKRPQPWHRVLINRPKHLQKRPRHRKHRASRWAITTTVEETHELSLDCPPVVPPQSVIHQNDGIRSAKSLFDRVKVTPTVGNPTSLREQLHVGFIEFFLGRRPPAGTPLQLINWMQWETKQISELPRDRGFSATSIPDD